MNQILAQLQAQVPTIPSNLRIDIVPASSSGGQHTVPQGAGGDAYMPGLNPGYVQGGKSRGRTPVINLLAGMTPEATDAALRHEIGHQLAPFLLRTPERGRAFLNAFSKSGTHPPKWLNPRGGNVDAYGLSSKSAPNENLSPEEYYANIVATQLGAPSYADPSKMTPQRVSELGTQGITPTPQIQPMVLKRLLAQGLIPRSVNGSS